MKTSHDPVFLNKLEQKGVRDLPPLSSFSIITFTLLTPIRLSLSPDFHVFERGKDIFSHFNYYFFSKWHEMKLKIP
jgi:hypothetical protein